MKVAQWGESLAVKLPNEVVEQLGLKSGDEIDVKVSLAPVLDSEVLRRREDALAAIRAMRRPFPKGWKFDREEANKRGP